MLEPQPNGPVTPQTTQAPPKRTNVVWRFYVDPQGGWRWQQLASDQRVLADSPGTHATYDDCVRDAETHGYRFAPSQEKVILPSRTNTHIDGWR
jgi:hypothetical protein